MIGTGHGALLTFLQSTAPSADADDIPLGIGPFLIRDVQLHEESGPSADLSHLQTPATRRYAKTDLYDIGVFSFNVLFDTEIEPIIIYPPGSGMGTKYSYPLPIIGAKLQDMQVNTNKPGFFNGEGLALIQWPIRNPAFDTPAQLGPQMAHVASRGYGNLNSNQEQLSPVSMQWQQAPAFVQELDSAA